MPQKEQPRYQVGAAIFGAILILLLLSLWALVSGFSFFPQFTLRFAVTAIVVGVVYGIWSVASKRNPSQFGTGVSEQMTLILMALSFGTFLIADKFAADYNFSMTPLDLTGGLPSGASANTFLILLGVLAFFIYATQSVWRRY